MYLEQPFASMVFSGSYSCDVLDDGTEVFTGGGVTVTIPPSCVQWAPGRKEELTAKKKKKGTVELSGLMRELEKQELETYKTRHARFPPGQRSQPQRHPDGSPEQLEEDLAAMEALISVRQSAARAAARAVREGCPRI